MFIVPKVEFEYEPQPVLMPKWTGPSAINGAHAGAHTITNVITQPPMFTIYKHLSLT